MRWLADMEYSGAYKRLKLLVKSAA